MSKLHSERLILRPININDCDDIFEYASNPHVGPNAGWKPHESKEETLEIMKTLFLDKDTIWGIMLKDSQKLIGTIGLVDDSKRVNDQAKMLGYAIGEKYWGKGFMTEAAGEVLRYGFNGLQLDLISAYCYPFNKRSQGVIKKCGFIFEGVLKKAEKIYNGDIFDIECYALTADEYFAIK